MNFIQQLIEIILEFFKGKEIVETKKENPVITKVPEYSDKGSHVVILQNALNAKGAKLTADGDFGQKTKEAVSVFQKSIGLKGSGVIGPKTLEGLDITLGYVEPKETKTPWFWEAKKHEGKNEADVKFQEEMNPYWAKAGLPQYKGLVGSARAWCALFILSSLAGVGYNYTKGNASAKSWDNFGQKIDWKVNGFPQGAIIRINHSAKCTSSSGNHVTFANGFCSAQDLLKSGASFSGYGGNQGNAAKVSTYPVAHICAVRWPLEEKLPEKVITSVNCSNGKTDTNESTR